MSNGYGNPEKTQASDPNRSGRNGQKSGTTTKYGGPGGIRTRDLPVPRARPCEPDVLRPHRRAYQAELPAQRVVRSEVACPLIAVSRSYLDERRNENGFRQALEVRGKSLSNLGGF